MIICGCSVEAQYIKKELEIKKPLKNSWKEFLKRQEAKKNGKKDG